MERFSSVRASLHGDVTLLVGGSAAQEGYVYREGPVEEVFRAVELEHLDEVLGSHLVHLAAFEARVHEGAFADCRDHTWPAGGDLPKQVRDYALRETVSLNLVLQGQLT
jgi:hypothetical protein